MICSRQSGSPVVYARLHCRAATGLRASFRSRFHRSILSTITPAIGAMTLDHRSTLVAAVAAALGIAAACSSDPARTGPTGDCIPPTTENFVDSAQGRVVIVNSTFIPGNIRVRDGMTVRWVYCEPGSSDAHTTTSDNGVWDSGLMARGSTFSRVFATMGSFPYHCIPHPEMVAVVTVVD